MSDLNVLIVGGGGREHALAWRLERSPRVRKIFIAPGNGGTQTQKTTNIPIRVGDFEGLKKFALENDVFGIPVFGPSQKAAQMEGSKAFSKDFMRRHNIPTAAYRTFKSPQFDEALKYAKTCGFKVVLKASGLAA
ncbi:unnamed protein product, partial [Rhizoctonia solani]